MYGDYTSAEISLVRFLSVPARFLRFWADFATLTIPPSQRTYLQHVGEGDGVTTSTGGEADAGLAGNESVVDGLVVAGAVLAPLARAVLEPLPHVRLALQPTNIIL